jgi:hypothetical protein
MGNSVEVQNIDDFELQNQVNNRFIVKFIRVNDIPLLDGKTKVNPYLKAYIQNYIQLDESMSNYKLQRISSIVTTPKRVDCDAVTYNCFRDFQIVPPASAILTIEIFHNDGTESEHLKLGYINIEIKDELSNEIPKSFNFVHKVIIIFF